MVWAPLGCGGGAEGLSNSSYLLEKLGQAWTNARTGLAAETLNLEPLRGVHVMLGRTYRRIQKDYTGPNKEQLLAKLAELNTVYEAHILPKLNLRDRAVSLAPGATVEQVRAEFKKLEPAYAEIEALTKAE
jgi:hypothetical protein